MDAATGSWFSGSNSSSAFSTETTFVADETTFEAASFSGSAASSTFSTATTFYTSTFLHTVSTEFFAAFSIVSLLFSLTVFPLKITLDASHFLPTFNGKN